MAWIGLSKLDWLFCSPFYHIKLFQKQNSKDIPAQKTQFNINEQKGLIKFSSSFQIPKCRPIHLAEKKLIVIISTWRHIKFFTLNQLCPQKWNEENVSFEATSWENTFHLKIWENKKLMPCRRKKTRSPLFPPLRFLSSDSIAQRYLTET